MGESPLIIEKLESGMLASLPRARPDAVFVLSYRDGGLRSFHGAPGFADRTGSRWCFVVDGSQRFSSGDLRIPARGDVHFFSAWFDAAWQVSDAEAVVRSNLTHGGPVVSGYLKSALWPLGRQFDPDDAQRAEEAIRRSLRTPLPIGSGLTLNGLTVRLSIDKATSGQFTAVEDERQRQLLVQMRVDQLHRLVGTDVDPVLIMHLAGNPDDTGAALGVLNASRQQDRDHQLALLDRFIAAGIVTDVDNDLLRPMLGIPAQATGNPAIVPGYTPAIGGGRSPMPALGGNLVVPAISSPGTTTPAPPPPTVQAAPVQQSPTVASAPTVSPAPAPDQGGSVPTPAMRPFAYSKPPALDPNGPQDQPYSAPAPSTLAAAQASPAGPVETPAAPAAPKSPDGVKAWRPLRAPGQPRS